jgi:NADH:ubiquinone oxidoreductase subunit 6 (subunit J)
VQREDGEASQSPGLRTTAIVLGAVLLVQAGMVLWSWQVVAPAGFDASTVKVAQALFSARYLYVFEATSVLILAALVGAIALAKRER